MLNKDGTSPIIKTDNPTVMNIKTGQQVSFSGTIDDQSDVSKIQVFVDDVLYGTFQGVKNIILPSNHHQISLFESISSVFRYLIFRKNLQTLVHTVIVQ